MNEKKIAVIGSGPAGCTASIYLSRAGYKVLQILGPQIGGQLTITTDVENYPGIISVNGPTLVDNMITQSKNFGSELIQGSVVEVDFSGKPFKLKLDDDSEISCDAVIISTGAKAKWLGLESEEKFKNYGVSACATCDGYFYRNKDVAIVGGGNTAVSEAIFLSNIAKSVTLIHRKDKLKAEYIIQQKMLSNTNISVLFNTIILEVIGNDNPRKVSAIKCQNLINQSITQLPINGLFVAIGHKPQTDLFVDKLLLNEDGYIKIVNGQTGTSVDGVFAAGDVQDTKFQQAVSAAGFGCMAAIEVAEYLNKY